MRVRGRSWLLHAVTAHADCSELHLEAPAGSPPGSHDSRAVLLTPFDRPTRLALPSAVRVVSRRAWMAALRLAILTGRGARTLAAPVCADIDLLPHQLEPAMAVVRHGARRLLLADAVGLGKTIEAGLIIAELRARSSLGRVLVLAPPGLCDQWSAELAGRFGMECSVADAAWLRAQRAALPASVNPWSVPGIRVASQDFAKRPEVRRSLEQVPWDALIVDEAHLAAGDSERRAAAHEVASRSRLVLLLTATPHSGDPLTFQALCGIGALAADDPVAMFRRDRSDAGVDHARRVHMHRVRSTPAERDVRRQLDAYVRRVWARRSGPDGQASRLAMIVLLKRSLSGMAPLRQSLLTRLHRLGADAPAEATQLELGWDDEPDAADEAPSRTLGAPGLDDASEERIVVGALADLARAAEPHDSKRRALRRLLGRLREPAIVFTEYRDTLIALQGEFPEDTAVLHGAMDRAGRSEVVRRFNRGSVRVLLATDAAGEGLNLQHNCRLVVNLELPWNPMRLEQRIGRVDRIGQRRRVHAINLVAAGTAESGLLVRLACRLDRARAALGPLDDVLGVDEEALVSGHVGCASGARGIPLRPALRTRLEAGCPVCRPDVKDAARDLIAHLEWRRLLQRVPQRSGVGRTGAGLIQRRTGVHVAAVRRSTLPAAMQRAGTLAVFRVQSKGHGGLVPSDDLVPVFAPCACPRLKRASEVRTRARAAIEQTIPHLAAAIVSRAGSLPCEGERFDRDARLAARAQARRRLQPGLFDRRAERAADGEDAGLTTWASRCQAGAASVGAGSGHALPEPRLELLLFVTS